MLASPKLLELLVRLFDSSAIFTLPEQDPNSRGGHFLFMPMAARIVVDSND